MMSEERREKIFSILKDRSTPITGADLSKITGVSRQVIVQDIAILRAKGLNIIATPQGYLLMNDRKNKMEKVIACCQTDRYEKRTGDIVDNGGKVIDVIVEHSLYGEIKAMLMLESRLI